MDEASLWLNLLLRWIHVIAGIAWIGASFYFNWLEGNLEREHKPDGIAGDLWAVHGGGFYHVLKLRGAPEKLPPLLHWFKYEAYLTWISGFSLLALIYYFQGSVYLLDPAKSAITLPQGVALSVSSIVCGWLVYHLLCNSRLKAHPRSLFAVVVTLLSLAAWSLDAVFSNRAAYLHIGAIIGTIMAANVFFVIIPSQKILVASAEDGRAVDLAHLGANAGLRSLHNNYFTLPLLFIMISTHYPMTFDHRYGVVILLAISLVGVLTRHYFNLKNRRILKVWILPAALVGFVLIGAFSYAFKERPFGGAMTKPKDVETAIAVAATDFEAARIIDLRCRSCHSSAPTDDMFTTAPNGLMLDSLEVVRAKKSLILERVITTQNMPLANKTHMTDEERQILAAWLNHEGSFQ